MTIIVHVLIQLQYIRGKTILCPFRSVLVPSDLATFDSIVSPHEIAALQKRMLLGNRETPPTTVTTPPHSSASSKVMGLQTQTKVTPATVTRPSLSEAKSTERREEREDAAATGREREVGAHSNDRRREREVPAGYMERGGATRQPAGSWRERENGGEEIERVSGRMMTGPEAVVTYTPEEEVGGVGSGEEEEESGSSRGGGEREEEEERTESPPDTEAHEVVEEEEEERRLEDIMEEEERGEEGETDRHVDQGDSGDGAEEEGELEPVTVQDNYNLVLYEIQSEPILSPNTHSYLFTPSHLHFLTPSSSSLSRPWRSGFTPSGGGTRGRHGDASHRSLRQ